MSFYLRHALWVALLLPLGACAAPEPPTTLPLDRALGLALQRNPRLSSAAHEIAAAQAGVRSAGALRNPEITFTPGITSLSGTGEEFLAQQPLELNGARSARRSTAEARLRERRAEAVIELRNLVAETKTAYYNLARARELRDGAAEQLRIAEEFDRATRRQVEVGSRPGIDQTQTGVEVARARQQLFLAEGRATAAEAGLNLLLANPPGTPIGVLERLTPAGPGMDGAAVRADPEHSRAEVAAAQALRDALHGEARSARVAGRPDLAPQLRAGSVTRGFHDAGVGVGITLPLLDWGSRRNRVREADEAVRAQEGRIAAERLRVQQELEQARAHLTAADAVLRSFEQGLLEQARTLLDGSQKGFLAGVTSIVGLLEARRTYAGVQNDYTNALADYAVARAELERAAGTVPPTLLPTLNPEGAKRK